MDFSKVQIAPPDPIFNLNTSFKADSFPKKVNLGVGAYRDETGQPLVLECVKRAEQTILADPKKFNHEYLGIDGNKEFCNAAAKLLLGETFWKENSTRVATCQSISGTGAVRLVAEFLFNNVPKAEVYLSDPTWGNHKNIFNTVGFATVKSYRYYNRQSNSLDLSGYISDIENAPRGSIFVLHACAHNPTGLDPTKEQWQKIAAALKAKDQIIVVDNAYQGFATGDIEEDAWATRYFAQNGFSFFVCQSFAKNMGLYGERAGVAYCVTQTERDGTAVNSQFKKIVRPMYSNPPIHGSLTVLLVLSTPDLYQLWKKEVKGMADRIIQMRNKLRQVLVDLQTPGNWDHIVTQIGMFCYTGLNKQQVENLTQKHHIYLTADGRISMAGLNDSNIQYVASAINDVVRTSKL